MNQALIDIRAELIAPKNQYNNFGNYSYRSCESILEALKPLLKKHEASLTLTDDIVLVGDRYYVMAKAIFAKGDDIEIATAYAREPDSKKGMDSSQITGTASSYARKYALNGLFLIDDAKDADTNEYRDEREAKAQMDDPKVGAKQIEDMTAYAEEVGVSIETICSQFKIGSLQDMTMTMWAKAMNMLQKTEKKVKAS